MDNAKVTVTTPTLGTPLKPRKPAPQSAFFLVVVMGAALAPSGWAQGRASLPDPKLTPGDALAVTKSDVCTPGYSGKVRNVPQAVKEQAYKNYGITRHGTGDFEVDHLISLELGGSNSVKNLWPQSFLTQPWNAHVKDQLENELHRLVCSGQIDITTAQHDIATDWIAAYKKYFHTTLPLSKGGALLRTGPSQSAARLSLRERIKNSLTGRRGQVWVNLSSGKYFYPGTHYYGKTKQGKYLSEAQAKQQGYTAAKEQK